MSDGDERVKKERDLYLRLLELGQERDLQKLLGEALALAVDITGAECGYLELHGNDAADSEWSISRGCSDETTAEIRSVTSKGIVTTAMAEGRTINTPFALLDPKFNERASVKEQRLEAVLCTPIGGAPAIGVLYLQGRRRAGPFKEEHVKLAELLARHLAPTLESVAITALRRLEDDPTQPWRRKLDASRLIGRSAALAHVLEETWRVATFDSRVLITGASGTGKTALARVIHDNSKRRRGPFLELNCANMSEERLERELFGTLAGAYTGATRDMPGKFEAVRGGTLFLDEIAELPLGAQAKLLQVLQSSEYFPMGANAPSRADVRIIAATNADLDALVASKEFREDLLYRLKVLPIRMPLLAERREDVTLLAQHMVATMCRDNAVAVLSLSPGACRALEGHDWPGNIRELENVLFRGVASATAESSARIESRHLFGASITVEMDTLERPLTLHEATARFQKKFVADALDAMGWNIKETAVRLDVNRSHVYNLITRFNLKRR